MQEQQSEQKTEKNTIATGILAVLAICAFFAFLFVLPWLGDTLAPYRSVIGLILVGFFAAVLTSTAIYIAYRLGSMIRRDHDKATHPAHEEEHFILLDQQPRSLPLDEQVYQRGYAGSEEPQPKSTYQTGYEIHSTEEE